MTIRPLILILALIAPFPAFAQDWTAKVQTLPADGSAKDQGRGPPPQLNP